MVGHTHKDISQVQLFQFKFSVYSLVCVLIEKIQYIKHLRQCFISYPNISHFIKNTCTLLCVIFSSLLLVSEYPDETLRLMFDVSLHSVLGQNT